MDSWLKRNQTSAQLNLQTAQPAPLSCRIF